jgi:hypothetical protein
MQLVHRPLASAIAKRVRDLRLASFSDVHLGHSSTPTSLIIANLYKAFPDNSETGELDLILLGGDLFDSELHYSDPEIREIEMWMFHFISMCARRKIVLRILEGTFSHDRGQGFHFDKIDKLLKLAGVQADFRYVKTIEVEKIESLGISILYVPDYTTVEMDRLWKEVQEALQKAGVTSVDYANIHGAFTYQMPPIARVQAACHSMERYLSIVDNYIFTGHIHLSSIYERILSNGSFDRLAHGEEEAKGHWRAHVRKNGEDDFIFQENLSAKLYKSVAVQGLDIDTAMATVNAAADVLPSGSAIRIVADKGEPILHAIGKLRREYPMLQWSSKSVEVKDIQKNLLQDLRGEFKETPITSENIKELLMPRILNRTDDQTVIDRCHHFLGVSR